MSESWQQRQIALIGKEATDRLTSHSVMVFGVGGVGGYVVESLARAGVGRLILVDHDRISDTNRNRQIIALCSTVGRQKTEVLAQRIADINPECSVDAYPTFVTPDNADELIAKANPDWIVDAVDNVAAKIAIALSAKERRIPMIASMGTGNKLCPEKLTVADLAKTSVCPLARVMRRELKERGISHMTVLFSTELPSKAEAGERTPASISFVPSAAGLLIASHLVRAVIEGKSDSFLVGGKEEI